MPREDVEVESSRILHPSYLEKHANKKDLIRRLRSIVYALQTDESIEPDSKEFPGLATTAALVCQRFLVDRDKDVRLYSLLVCMEILSIYAPDCPFDEDEILVIFQQIISQVGNLSHTVDPKMKNYKQYYRMLELLAHVKMGVVLVELGKTCESELSENPVQVLAELFHTLMHAVHKDHSQQVLELVQAAVTACLDEYVHSVPIPLLDEILLCIGQGPTVWVTNPAALRPQDANSKSKTKEPLQIEQTNPTYVVAASILRSALNRIAIPVAQLLNGLLNGDSHVVSESNIQTGDGESNLYNIIFELHRVAPQILTTVIGTLSNGLQNPDGDQRLEVVTLLGRVFAAPKMASQFHACYREWLRRSHDVQVDIRRIIVKYLCHIIALPHSDTVEEANRALIPLVTSDPSLAVRQEAIHLITDTVYRKAGRASSGSVMTVSADLLQAVGTRVSSKQKEERRSALTGLGQIYYRHFVLEKLHAIQAAGDDVDISLVLSVLHDSCHLNTRRQHRKGNSSKCRRGSGVQHQSSSFHLDADEEIYRWIPCKVFESAFFTDDKDPDMRCRVVQIIDEVLLGSELSSKSSKKLSPTARAVGFTLIIDSLADDSDWFLDGTNAFKFLKHLFGQRASLQSSLSQYLDARATIRDYDPGTEEALLANAKARERLHYVGSISAPPTGSGSKSLEDILDALHGAKDKHIFRLLSTIVDPLQTPNARARALDDLPKRTKALGEAVSSWVKNLVRRCSMGDFMNGEVVARCVILAQECFVEQDISACSILLASAKTAIDVFPALGSPDQTFQNLTKLLCDCRSVHSHDLKQEVEESGILTTLSSILKVAAKKRSLGGKESNELASEDFRKQLLQLCTRDGTPEQARNAVYTLARLLMPPDQVGSVVGSSETTNKTEGQFASLLKALTSPSRMTIEDESSKIISILSSLTALTDCAPHAFVGTERGKRAIRFALESVLMGHGSVGGCDNETDSEEDNDPSDTPSPRNKKSFDSASKKIKHLSPDAAASLLEDANLSIPCRRVCASIELLVSFVRSSLLRMPPNSKSALNHTLSYSDDLVDQIFSLLGQILRDGGIPPSNRDRRACKARQDRAALRQCAGVHLLRLCDKRIGLEPKYLTPPMYHILSDTFLDEERIVREAMVKELSQLLVGTGVFGLEGSGMKPQPPPLRCLAFIALCSDGDHRLDHDAANGNAANIGRLANSVKDSAFRCIEKLREVCDSVYAQLRASGRDADTKFDSKYKTLLMPEYAVPFALHLIVHRRETPSEEAATAVNPASNEDGDDDNYFVSALADEESQHRILRKRLKLIFEPLVRSLGDGADNISFFLRMVEVLGKQYHPVDASPNLTRSLPSPLHKAIGSDSSLDTSPRFEQEKRRQLLGKKLKVVCSVARNVLFSFVKKDVNLAPYPGTICLPSLLFKKSAGASDKQFAGAEAHTGVSPQPRSDHEKPKSRKIKTPQAIVMSEDVSASCESKASVQSLSKARLTPKPSTQPSEFIGSHVLASARKVHFSPDIEIKLSVQPDPLTGDDGKEVSPIVKSNSPHSLRHRLCNSDSPDSATLGSSPPSALRIATMRSTAPEISSVESPPDGEKELSSVVRTDVAKHLSSKKDMQVGCFADDEGGGGFSQESLLSSVLESHSQKTSKIHGESNVLRGGSGLRRSASRSMPRSARRGTAKAAELVPKQIKISRDIAPSTRISKRKTDDLDFDFDDSTTENYPPRHNKSARSSGLHTHKTEGTSMSASSKPVKRRSRRDRP